VAKVNKLAIFRGDSSDTIQVKVLSNGAQVTGLIAAGYTGTFSIVASLGSTPLVTKTLTEVTNTFRSTLLPADTAGIIAGFYKGIVQVINSGLDYKKEYHLDVRINEQGFIE